jgi:hypothetical protein
MAGSIINMSQLKAKNSFSRETIVSYHLKGRKAVTSKHFLNATFSTNLSPIVFVQMSLFLLYHCIAYTNYKKMSRSTRIRYLCVKLLLYGNFSLKQIKNQTLLFIIIQARRRENNLEMPIITVLQRNDL